MSSRRDCTVVPPAGDAPRTTRYTVHTLALLYSSRLSRLIFHAPVAPYCNFSCTLYLPFHASLLAGLASGNLSLNDTSIWSM